MSWAALIGRFATGTYTVKRRAAGSVANGVYTQGSESTIEIVACEQPDTGEDAGRTLQPLSEGQHAPEIRVLYTATPLFTVRTNVVADRVVIDGEDYTVQKVATWKDRDVEIFYRVEVTRQVTP